MHKEEPLTRLVRSLRSGQITIPAAFRKKLGITEQSILQMTVDAGELRIKPVRVKEATQGSPWVKQAYDLFAPVREEAIEQGYTEEEINADIDAAVAAVRQQH